MLTCELKLSRVGDDDFLGVLHDITEHRKRELFSKVQLAWKSAGKAGVLANAAFPSPSQGEEK